MNRYLGPTVLFLLFSIFVVFAVDDQCGLGIVDNGVSDNEKDDIVNFHNDIRLRIARGKLRHQPRGVNLKRLYWDEKLAQKAQEIADTCIFEHVTVDDDRWSWVGQNLFIVLTKTKKTGANWDMAIHEWFIEHKDFIYPNVSIGGRKIGHYTQLVWADTQYVGCGYTSWRPAGFARSNIYVCNYGPGGNYVGEAPYKTGRRGCENLC